MSRAHYLSVLFALAACFGAGYRIGLDTGRISATTIGNVAVNQNDRAEKCEDGGCNKEEETASQKWAYCRPELVIDDSRDGGFVSGAEIAYEKGRIVIHAKVVSSNLLTNFRRVVYGDE